jgi:ubiquinol-cytochrome c reductase iron-sulfur subunit
MSARRRLRSPKMVAALGAAIAAFLAFLLGKRIVRPHSVESPGVAAIGWAFLLSFAGSVTLTVVYALGGQPQIEGAMLFVSLGGIAVGLILWSHVLMPQGIYIEERRLTFEEPVEEAEAEEAFVAGAEQIGRRRFLGRMLALAGAALGAALVFPIRSLGTRPGRSLFVTSWRRGIRAVTQDGKPVRASELVANSVLTVFPEGHTDAADSQTILIKTPAGTLRALPGREGWSPEGIVAFSKICTHAGCPVGLYQATTSELFCPCHQSVFFVPEGAKATKGPATRPLPQLPLAIDSDGYVIAQRDFPEPVGPEFWNFGRRS